MGSSVGSFSVGSDVGLSVGLGVATGRNVGLGVGLGVLSNIYKILCRSKKANNNSDVSDTDFQTLNRFH